jgi:hypothetical protein
MARPYPPREGELLSPLPSGWKLSSRGNWWRLWGDKTVTIFKRPNGRYAWCCSTAGGPCYSQDNYPTPIAAVQALMKYLEALETRSMS